MAFHGGDSNKRRPDKPRVRDRVRVDSNSIQQKRAKARRSKARGGRTDADRGSIHLHMRRRFAEDTDGAPAVTIALVAVRAGGRLRVFFDLYSDDPEVWGGASERPSEEDVEELAEAIYQTLTGKVRAPRVDEYMAPVRETVAGCVGILGEAAQAIPHLKKMSDALRGKVGA